jgi:tetrahydromethanopterin S-methyltransferase subunit G
MARVTKAYFTTGNDNGQSLGDGEPPGGEMERVVRLEAQMESVDRRLDKIDEKLDRIIERTGRLPTTNGLWGMIATVIGVGLAISGLTFAIADYASKIP